MWILVSYLLTSVKRTHRYLKKNDCLFLESPICSLHLADNHKLCFLTVDFLFFSLSFTTVSQSYISFPSVATIKTVSSPYILLLK